MQGAAPSHVHGQAMSVCALQTATAKAGCKCSMLANSTCRNLLACTAFTWRIAHLHLHTAASVTGCQFGLAVCSSTAALHFVVWATRSQPSQFGSCCALHCVAQQAVAASSMRAVSLGDVASSHALTMSFFTGMAAGKRHCRTPASAASQCDGERAGGPCGRPPPLPEGQGPQ